MPPIYQVFSWWVLLGLCLGGCFLVCALVGASWSLSWGRKKKHTLFYRGNPRSFCIFTSLDMMMLIIICLLVRRFCRSLHTWRTWTSRCEVGDEGLRLPSRKILVRPKTSGASIGRWRHWRKRRLTRLWSYSCWRLARLFSRFLLLFPCCNSGA